MAETTANYLYICYDDYNVILARILSSGMVTTTGPLHLVSVNHIPEDWESAKYIWNVETEDYEINPDYESMTVAEKVYVANVGWRDDYPDAN